MSNEKMEWVVIKGRGDREIGAIGFIGRKAAVVAAFYDDYDSDRDGDVTWGEWVSAKLSPIRLNDREIVRVAMAARLDMEVLKRDESFDYHAKQLYVSYAAGLVSDGLYAAHFSRALGGLVRPIAKRLTDSLVKQFVILKGTEAAVMAAHRASVAI